MHFGARFHPTVALLTLKLSSELHWNASSDFMEISRRFIQIQFYASVVWLKIVFV